MKILMIYNPVSGISVNRNVRIGKVILELGAFGNELTVYQTQSSGDGRDYLMSHELGEYKLIVVCGGDGTLHEMVDGAIKADFHGDIGYIPFGSTNDFANSLGIGANNATSTALNGSVSMLDVCKFDTGDMLEHFNYVAAFGVFTGATYKTPQHIKNGVGYLAYILEGAKELSSISPIQFKCETDDGVIEDKILVGIITNSLSVGGVKLADTGARLDDGLLEYIFIKYPSNIVEIQSTLICLLNGKFYEKYMYSGHSSVLKIESDKIDWNLDGESGGCHEHAQISVLNKRLHIKSK